MHDGIAESVRSADPYRGSAVRTPAPGRFTLPLAAWHAWTPGNEAGTAAAFIDPLLRRRLSPLGKAGLQVAEQCAAGHQPLRIVYGSRHGELARSAEMLTALSRRESVSPTSFSLSVLNALPGVYSIHRADRAPGTAISAGAETLGWSLVEAATQYFSAPEQPVLMLYADAPLPALYADRASGPAQLTVLGLLFAAGGAARLTVAYAPAAAGPPTADAQADVLLAALARQEPSRWHGAVRDWEWGLLE